RAYAAGFLLLAGAVIAISVVPVPAAVRPWSQSLPICVAYVVGVVFAARALLAAAVSAERQSLRTGTVALAAIMAFSYAGIIVTALVRRSADAPAAVAARKERLPAAARR